MKGGVYNVCGQDPDLWSYFEACDLIKSMGSSFKIEDVKIWWKFEHGSLENYLKPLVNDEDATIERLKEKEKDHDNIKENEDGEDSESSEDSLDVIHFEDSEEEMMHDFDEDIGEELNNRVDNGAGTGGVYNGDGISQIDNVDGTSQMDNGQGIHKGMTTVEMDREYVVDDYYITNELDMGQTVIVIMQFKKVVLEHNVLNGREVRFAKNDGQGVGLFVRTNNNKHKYGRKFFNKNANANWVSRVIVDKLKNNSGMKLNEVVADVRLSGIDPDELEALLNDDHILDIAPLRIDTSPVKNNRLGPRTFIGKCPKVKLMISPRKKSKIVVSPSRMSDRLMTLKTKNIEGPGRDPNDPFVIPEEDSTIGSTRGRRNGMTSRRA
ncbi:unnamed protein product [Vicia faba]|uniref:Uncharacterized protein n=1 Tax=Vicia faba TaxID=3906 RepID=A0AAV0YYS0_VICFA|nr:unnamed protein product [Vicia faba]